MNFTLRYLEKLLVREYTGLPQAGRTNEMSLQDAQVSIALTSPETLCKALRITDLDPAGVYDDVCRDLDTLEEDLGNNVSLREAVARLKAS